MLYIDFLCIHIILLYRQLCVLVGSILPGADPEAGGTALTESHAE
jgi:hypothetical protein